MSEAQMIAVGDQVQATLMNSEVEFVGFVLVAANGEIEYRSPVSIESFRTILQNAVDVL